MRSKARSGLVGHRAHRWFSSIESLWADPAQCSQAPRGAVTSQNTFLFCLLSRSLSSRVLSINLHLGRAGSLWYVFHALVKYLTIGNKSLCHLCLRQTGINIYVNLGSSQVSQDSEHPRLLAKKGSFHTKEEEPRAILVKGSPLGPQEPNCPGSARPAPPLPRWGTWCLRLLSWRIGE